MAELSKDHSQVVLGNYKILTRIGQGGMAAVYKAQDLATGKIVALKVLNPELAQKETFVRRFLDEALAAASVKHPNIIQIYSIGEHEKKHHFFAMEYVEHGSLARLLKRGRPIPLRQAVNYVLQAARGLQEALLFGIVHRDVKPSNLLLTSKGVVKVADFGLAQVTSAETTPMEGRKAIGTPAYMSPEQAAFDAVDHRSDIYSLGATFFHLVTGRQPFHAKTPQEVLQKHRTEPVPSPRELNPILPLSICAVILKMMAKAPFDRYQTYDELIADLVRVQDELEKRARTERLELLARRAAAFALDNVLVFVLAALVIFTEEGTRFFTQWTGLIVACALCLLVLTVYATVMLARFGQTLGMMLLGLRLCDTKGHRPWWGVALVRSLAVNTIYLFILFPTDRLAEGVFVLWCANSVAALFRKDAKPWHDILCGTVLYKIPPRKLSPTAVVRHG